MKNTGVPPDDQTTQKASADAFSDDHARTLLESRGLHATRPRRVLLSVLSEALDHPTPESIIRSLENRGASLPPATVYQNLHILTLHGLLTRFLDWQGLSRFEARLEPHSHFICNVCGRVDDMEEQQETLFARPLELCSGSAQSGWQVQPGSMHVLGICPSCRADSR